MNRLAVLCIVAFMFAPKIFPQSAVVFEHSNDFPQIHEKFQQRVFDICNEYNYFTSALEEKYFPVLNDDNTKIVGGDKFFILWMPGNTIDLNILYLCNNEARTSVIFVFRKEEMDEFTLCTRPNISHSLLYLLFPKFYDPKWFIMPDSEQ